MYTANDQHMPTPLTGSLDDLVLAGSTAERAINVQICHNMGNRTFLLSLPMKEFYDQSIVANETGLNGEPVAQRKLDKKHAAKLAKYLLKGLLGAAALNRKMQNKPELKEFEILEELLGKQPYVSIQPLVCNLRNIAPSGSSLRAERMVDKATGITAGFRVYLPQEVLFYVVDGQHRRYAMQMLLDFLHNTIQTRKLSRQTDNLLLPESGDASEELIIALQDVLQVASTFATVQVEAHLGLDADQERQLFHDLNNLGKKVESSLVLQFDSANPVNNYVKEYLIESDEFCNLEIVEKEVSDWNKDDGSISRKELSGVNARLFLNKSSINNAPAQKVSAMTDIANAFWQTVSNLEHMGQPGSKSKTVVAQALCMKGVARVVYDLSQGKKRDENALEELFEKLENIDFSHSNPLWRYFTLSEQERVQFGLSNFASYITDEISEKMTKKGFSTYNDGIVRFGNQHNDFAPIMSDMIRFSLGMERRKLPTKRA
ncbi:DNA sulfur modification protein DndB [Photobacterium sp. SDRW27]|uniref:DNA sulfur modification protein DndB n=1 Tax=Photobacterium obscurum TaxID=2829490 RepID=UPI002244404F|nr:DNA sulfur modification protein DndB [Photobacterium obscurum]MCW8332039.1 DNA sulfur modification protein DndB [Photobacterium obscurum]